MVRGNTGRNWYKPLGLCAVGILSLLVTGKDSGMSVTEAQDVSYAKGAEAHFSCRIGEIGSGGKTILKRQHMLIGADGKEAKVCESVDAVLLMEGEEWEDPILVNQYFLLYEKPSKEEWDVAYTVDVARIRQQAGLCDSWIAFEGMEGKIPNVYAMDTRDGYIKEELVDKENQMYQGRFMVAVGPAVMNPEYDGAYVNASDMHYGTFLDVVLIDSSGEEFFIPCVVADCKMHTYPDGYYQTGKALQRNGTLGYVPQCADYSFVEFTADRLNTDGTSRSAGLCSEYQLDRIIVYTLEASLRGE